MLKNIKEQHIINFIFVAFVVFVFPKNCLSLPAFPGAEGFGAETIGGRFGEVIKVTTLNDAGIGSLREALESQSPRTVIFRIGGTITLDSTINITSPFITIAGQSAPGGGITIKTNTNFDGPALAIKTHNVIVRFIRVRLGAIAAEDPGCCADGIVIADQFSDTYNIIVDHSSLSWATDENFSTWYGAHDVTVQWSIISEALPLVNNHGKGALLGDRYGDAERITSHHNLYAHNIQRNPNFATGGSDPQYSNHAVHLYNNLIYNWRDAGTEIQALKTSGMQVNIVGNYFKRGPNTRKYRYPIGMFESNGGLHLDDSIYVNDNLDIGDKTVNTDTSTNDWAIIGDGRSSASAYLGVEAPQSWQKITPWGESSLPVTLHSALDTYTLVLQSAGARLPFTDSVDLRIIQEVKGGSGRIIDDLVPSLLWPVLDAGLPLLDSDNDGMPDGWEISQGLNIFDPNDRNGDINGGGYTNLEVYLNALASDPDHDGLSDIVDNCPIEENPNQTNSDGDDFGNACDQDDDNDGMSDAWENLFELNPLDDTDAQLDTDNDGFSNLEKFEGGSDPNDSTSVPEVNIPMMPRIASMICIFVVIMIALRRRTLGLTAYR